MRSSGKLGDVEDQFSADVTSVDHLMCASSVLQGKHIDQGYADQATINQMGDPPHRVPSSLPVDNRNGLAEALPLGFLPIALDITVCGHCEDVDQPAARPEQLQRLMQGGGPYGVQDDINALSRPVANGLVYVFGPVVNNTVCAEASDIRHIGRAASRGHQQPSALCKLYGEAADTTRRPLYEHLLAWDHAFILC